jgi:hypothetical protein
MKTAMTPISQARATSPRARTSRVLAFFATLAALAAVLSAAPASAVLHGPDGVAVSDRTAHGSLVDVQVLVEGRSAPLYYAPGRWDRRYFQAFRGRHYALRITNRSGRRVGVVISVDGLNVVNGERSSLGRGESMYVLDPWESATIRGWRTSLEQVRQFVFVDEERSYATRTGQANGDMGWIRVLAFEERRPLARFDAPRIQRPYGDEASGRAEDQSRGRDAREAAPESKALPAPSEARAQAEEMQAPHAEKSLLRGMTPAAPRADAYPGTGWGERRHDPVQETWFVAAAAPSDHLVFRYEYANGLLALGIDLRGDRLWNRERGELGFAQPPKW